MNILVFTSMYPMKDIETKDTKAIHYFTREWIKQGHNVVVVHNFTILSQIYNFYNHSNKERQKNKKTKNYMIEGVKVLLLPIKRYIPRSSFIFRKDIKKARKEIFEYLNKNSFTPDIFIVHFPTEQWQIVESVQDKIKCNPIPIFHNYDLKSRNLLYKIILKSDFIGVRSKSIKEKIELIYGNTVESFPVISGAPNYIYSEDKNKNSNFNKRKKVILYAGVLNKGKNVDITIKALNKIKRQHDFIFKIIGDGPEKDNLIKLVDELEMNKKVSFLGRKTRTEVINNMISSDCFIMASYPETFGLVYIEAMACGCFVIGSKGQGIDGVIIDNINGYLVEPNNIDDLAVKINEYFNMEKTKLSKIIEKSMETGNKFNESSVAKQYLESILKHSKKQHNIKSDK